ncbi:16165_t:CDS:2 [Funneliformis mosseae]|uniref:16165_t:CDS:1 n=1 Tax=Funneliformis mosseae TaxID=27381 RepID=A0A9N9HJ67_FUNMO|nr:16165_t:CDS:2 [Funneliformis mosseae]
MNNERIAKRFEAEIMREIRAEMLETNKIKKFNTVLLIMILILLRILYYEEITDFLKKIFNN